MPDNYLSLTATPYIAGTGNPDTAFEVVDPTAGSFSPYAPGDLGKMFGWGDKIYRKVVLHANAGMVAVGQLLFWHDKAHFVVTNRSTDGMLGGVAGSHVNNVAGIIRGVIPINAQFFMLTHGTGVKILEVGAAAAGMLLVADAGAFANSLGIPIGTPAPTQLIGTVTGPTTDGSCTANLDIGNS